MKGREGKGGGGALCWGGERRKVRAARSLPAYVYKYTVGTHIVLSFRYSLAG